MAEHHHHQYHRQSVIDSDSEDDEPYRTYLYDYPTRQTHLMRTAHQFPHHPLRRVRSVGPRPGARLEVVEVSPESEVVEEPVVQVNVDAHGTPARSPSPHYHHHHDSCHDHVDSRSNARAYASALVCGGPQQYPGWPGYSMGPPPISFSATQITQLAEAEIAKTEERRRATINEFKAEQKEIEDAKDLAVEKYKNNRAAEEERKKAAEEAAVRKYKDDLDKKEEIQKAWEAKLAEDKKEKDDALKAGMREQLSKIGFSGQELDDMVEGKRPITRYEKYPIFGNHPVYYKIRKDRIEIATLNYYGLPWRIDPVGANPDNGL